MSIFAPSIRPLLISACAAALLGCGNGAEKNTDAPSVSQEAAQVATPSPIDTPFTLKDASEIDVDALLSLLPEGARPTYESAAFDAKLGATVLNNVRFQTAAVDIEIDGEGERPNRIGGEFDVDGFVIERAELYGVDEDAIDRLLTAETRAFDAPMESVFKKVRLFGLAGLGEDNQPREDFTIGAIEIDQLDLRQGIGKGADDAENEDSVEPNGLAVLANAVSFGGLYFKDINAETELEGDAALSVTAPDLRLVGGGGGKLGAMIANDLDYVMTQSSSAIAETVGAIPQVGGLLNGPLRNLIAPENQQMKIASAEWRDIDFSGLLPYGLKDELPPFDAKNLIDLGSATVINAETFVAGKRASIAPKTIVSAMEFTWLAPSKIRAVSNDAQYDYTAYLSDDESAAEALAILQKYGLDSIKGDSEMSYDWSADDGDAVFSTVYKSPVFADFTMDVALEGLSLEAIEASAGAGANPVADLAALTKAEIVLDDHTMLDAIFDLAALGGKSDLRTTTPVTMRFLGLQFAAINPRVPGYIESFAGFIESGGKLTIKAEPEDPIRLNTLSTQEPPTLPDVLNLTVTLEK